MQAYFELIEQYEDGLMTAGEKLAFENRLQQEPALQQALQDYRELNNIIGKHAAAEKTLPRLREILQKNSDIHFAEKTGAKVVSFKKYLIALAAAAAVILIFLFVVPGSSIDNFKVPDMQAVIVRGDEEVNEAGKLFNEGKYREAIPAFQKALETDSTNSTLQYFYAIALIKVKEYNQAIPLMMQLANGQSAFKNDAGFFVAYALYKNGDVSRAAELAKAVPAQSSYYTQAQELARKAQR